LRQAIYARTLKIVEVLNIKRYIDIDLHIMQRVRYVLRTIKLSYQRSNQCSKNL